MTGIPVPAGDGDGQKFQPGMGTSSVPAGAPVSRGLTSVLEDGRLFAIFSTVIEKSFLLNLTVFWHVFALSSLKLH